MATNTGKHRLNLTWQEYGFVQPLSNRPRSPPRSAPPAGFKFPPEEPDSALEPRD